MTLIILNEMITRRFCQTRPVTEGKESEILVDTTGIINQLRKIRVSRHQRYIWVPRVLPFGRGTSMDIGFIRRNRRD
jgi:hypothetical protein